jgi:hypothetical protein
MPIEGSAGTLDIENATLRSNAIAVLANLVTGNDRVRESGAPALEVYGDPSHGGNEARLEMVSNTATVSSSAFTRLTSNAGVLSIKTGTDASDNGTITFGGFANERLRITSDGKVGIGKTDPGAELHVVGTGAIVVPSGTTAQQPTGVTGMIRFNTETGQLEYHTGTAWVSIGEFSATGGIVDDVSSAVYKIHKFESAGTFQAYSAGNVDILVVGGGGAGGGGRHGGGGGAGAVIHAISVNITPGSYIITIGAGGSGAGGSTIPGDASNTTIVKDGVTLYSALRGGHGGTHPNPSNAKYEYGQDGGCGGGAGHSTTQTTTGYARLGLGLSATPAFGGNGGAGLNRAATGAGGGAGANGGTGTGAESAITGNGGDGGIGYQSDITGTSLYWSGGGGGSGSPDTYRNNSSCTWRGGDGGNGGGGGGAAGVTTSASGARGGNGGAGYNAGSAGVKTTVANACHGGAGGENTGGGGGGAGGWSSDGNGNGGNGGKGIVVIRYLK